MKFHIKQIIVLIAFILPMLQANAQKQKKHPKGAVLDKLYNVKTNGKYEHRFVYMPIKGPDGRIWLNNNLGADYANENSPVFNPKQQAKSKTDYHAYGSLYQWGREGDGHELINWSSATKGTPKYNKGWKSKEELTTYNEPCPKGYHTPTYSEWVTLHKVISGLGEGRSKSNKMWDEKVLNLCAAGSRHENPKGSDYVGLLGWYYSSTMFEDGCVGVCGISEGEGGVARDCWTPPGSSVRCIKD